MTKEVRSQNSSSMWLVRQMRQLLECASALALWLERGDAVGESRTPSGRLASKRQSTGALQNLAASARCFRVCCALVLATPLHAQLGLPADTDLFGDDIVRKIDIEERGRMRFGGDEEARKPKEKVAGFDHALVFQDGRQLRGELAELTKGEVVWRRPDAGEPLRFARDEVRRIVLAPGAEGGDSDGMRMDMGDVEAYVRAIVQQVAGGLGEVIGEAVAQSVTVDLARAVRIPQIVQTMTVRMTATMKEMGVGMNGGGSGEPEQKAESESASATLKLPGGDWLFGEVTSADGETFALKLPDSTTLTIARAPVEWLYFDARPAPAYGFAGGALDLESWPVRTAGARMEVAGGTLTLRDGSLLGRAVSPPKRFEVAFTVPADHEKGLRLWLQPFGPQPECYGTGTVELMFGSGEISRCIYIRKMTRKKTPVPKDPAGQKGPVSYRVFYDGLDKHLAVLRNGVQLGDWKFIEDDDKDAKDRPLDDDERDITISGLCFDRDGNSKMGLQFSHLRVQPWDGVVPQSGDAGQAGDWLSAGKERPVPGRLEAISEGGILFSGVQKKRAAGTLLRLRDASPSLTGADAMLVFGQQGEVSVAGLEIRDGRARGRTAFAPELDLPVAALQTVVFPGRQPGAEKSADALVFRNGDELRGTLLSAAAGAGLRWKMAGGQEIGLGFAHLAGVRFAAAGEAGRTGEMATVELCNGDRLRGEFTGLDEKQLHFQHAQLGTVQIARERLWSLYPNPRFPVWDGSRDAAAWIGERTGKGAGSAGPQAAQWTVLDGSYIQRGARGGSQETVSLRAPLKEIPERFEFRTEATDVNGNPPNFGLLLGTKDGKTSLQASFNYFNLSLYMNSPKGRGRNNSRNVPIREKVPDASSRLALRVFVDRKAGTADFFLNGALVTRIGQQANERLPGLGEIVSVSASEQEDTASILSNLWIGPWNGELPRVGDGVPAATALTNGDSAAGVPEKWHDGKFLVETAAGPLELPLEKVQAVEFGGAMTPERAAARIRLADGCAVNVDAFRWDGKELAAHSAILGDMRFSAGAVSELIFDPAPVRAPRMPVAKKLAQKDKADAASEEKLPILIDQ